MDYNENLSISIKEFQMTTKINAATHVARKFGPWVTLATSILVVAGDLAQKKD